MNRLVQPCPHTNLVLSILLLARTAPITLVWQNVSCSHFSNVTAVPVKLYRWWKSSLKQMLLWPSKQDSCTTSLQWDSPGSAPVGIGWACCWRSGCPNFAKSLMTELGTGVWLSCTEIRETEPVMVLVSTGSAFLALANRNHTRICCVCR